MNLERIFGVFGGKLNHNTVVSSVFFCLLPSQEYCKKMTLAPPPHPEEEGGGHDESL
jgi:hypothetical protein